MRWATGCIRFSPFTLRSNLGAGEKGDVEHDWAFYFLPLPFLVDKSFKERKALRNANAVLYESVAIV